jgi:hypothetical protein
VIRRRLSVVPGGTRPIEAAHRPRRRRAKNRLVLAAGAVVCVVFLLVGSAAAPRGMADKNLVQTTVAAGRFKTLASLVTKAGLADALSGKAPPYVALDISVQADDGPPKHPGVSVAGASFA